MNSVPKRTSFVVEIRQMMALLSLPTFQTPLFPRVQLAAGHLGSINDFVTAKSGWPSRDKSSPDSDFVGETIRKGRKLGEHRSPFSSHWTDVIH
jgi:hypothetical protein